MRVEVREGYHSHIPCNYLMMFTDMSRRVGSLSTTARRIITMFFVFLLWLCVQMWLKRKKWSLILLSQRQNIHVAGGVAGLLKHIR